VWEYDGVAWYGPFAPATRPSARFDDGSNMAWVGPQAQLPALRNRVVLYGGATPPDWTTVGELWAWDGATWQLLCSGCVPGNHSSAALALDRNTGLVLLAGGYANPNAAGFSSFSGTTFLLDSGGWTGWPSAFGPLATSAIVFYPGFAGTGAVLVIGGDLTDNNTQTFSDETWAYLPP
jgi:hypothetical protein